MSEVPDEKPAVANGEHNEQPAENPTNGENADAQVKEEKPAVADESTDAKPAVRDEATDNAEDSKENIAKDEKYRAPKKNDRKIKSEYNLEESSDKDEIRRQVEFYFSDSNLPIDNYLLGLAGGRDNKPIPLKVIHSFKRMQHFQPFSVVREAVKESTFVALNEDDEITRVHPLDDKFGDDPEANRKLVHTASMNRSIYAKGFGEEQRSTALAIEEFFQPYGPLKSVRLRRENDGEFKGSVFVEFEDEETQKKFLELDPMPQFEGKELKVTSKQAYVDEKHQGIIDGLVKPKDQRPQWNGNRERGGRGRGRGRGGRGGRGGYRDRDGGEFKRKRDRDDIAEDNWRERRERDNKSGRDRFGRDRKQYGRDRDDRSRSPYRKSRRQDEEGTKIKDEGGDAEVKKENGDAQAEAGAEKVDEKPAVDAPAVEA